MNNKTMDKLNDLFKSSTPLKFGQNSWHLSSGNTNDWKNIWDKLKICALKYIPNATRQEIMSAAKEKREGNTLYVPFEVNTFLRTGEICHYFTYKVWNLAKPEIETILSDDNNKRLLAYEKYRNECELGIALPPDDK